MGQRAVDNFELARWRSLSAASVLAMIADHVVQDRDYIPRASAQSTRWHVSAAGRDFEILCTGSKFHDMRAAKGGGGAIDLAMHLLGIDFKAAARLLRRSGI